MLVGHWGRFVSMNLNLDLYSIEKVQDDFLLLVFKLKLQLGNKEDLKFFGRVVLIIETML